MAATDSPRPAPPGWLDLPEVPRVLPFLVFLLIPVAGASLFSGAEFWMYAAKTIAVAGLLVWLRPWLPEMRWAISWEAVGVGLGIAVLWLAYQHWVPTTSQIYGWFEGGLGAMPRAKPIEPWNPVAFFKDNPALGWTFVVIRVLGRSLVVPMVEEVFYRSFAYRMLINSKFTEVPLSTYKPFAFFAASGLFALAHGFDLFVPGFLCGMAYQWVTIRKGRLGDAMTAHGITNLVISVWTIYRGEWHFT